jgi:hypothetical protein
MDKAKQMAMKKGATTFLNSPIGDAVADILAQKEIELTEKVNRLADETDLADPPTPRVDAEQRSDELKAGVEAIIEKDLPSFYIPRFVDCENENRVVRLAQKDDTDITDRMAGWVDHYRESDAAGDVSDLSDRKIVRRHVESTYDLKLEEFALLVHWRDGMHNAATHDLLLDGIQRSEDAIDEMADAAERGDA